MKKEKSIYADILESAISWRVRDMYNLYGTIRRVLFEGRRAERAAMLSELIKMQGGNIGGSAKAETLDDRLKLARELENMATKILQFTQTGDHRRSGRVQEAKNTLAQHKCESSSVDASGGPKAPQTNLFVCGAFLFAHSVVRK